MVRKILNNDFHEVLTLKAAIVDFSAKWCGPCRMLEPILELVSEEFEEKLNFYNVDIEENQKLAYEYKVTNVPSVFLFKNGEKKAQAVGMMTEEQLKKWIFENLE